MAITCISHISVYTKDQQQALEWYQGKLGFELCDDMSDVVPGFRWLTVAPRGNKSVQMVLMPILKDGDEQYIGTNPMCILGSSDCRMDCDDLESRGVTIVDPPMEMPWGVSAIICDLYGNPYNLVQFS